MSRHHPISFLLFILALSALACQAFQTPVEPTLPAVPTLSLPTATAVAPIDTTPQPTATLAATSVGVAPGDTPTVTALVDLNVRRGPGTQYDIISFLAANNSATIIGVDPATGWWKIVCPPGALGEECWLSGGARFSRADNAVGVPVAPAPPTPTPPPATATPEPTGTVEPTATSLAAPVDPFVVYIEDGDAWLRILEGPPADRRVGRPRQLTVRGNVQDVFISPDGRWLAYLGGLSEGNYLGLAGIAGGGDRIVARSMALPPERLDVITFIGNIEWLTNSRKIAFNTFFTNREGPGTLHNEDLWTVDLSGDVDNILAAGQGGGAFAVSPSGSGAVVMVSSNQIVRARIDGSARNVVADFPGINTASEFIYYAQPQWRSDGRLAYVGIPDSDPYALSGGSPGHTLWAIPPSGPADIVGRLEYGGINGVVWSPKATYLAYPPTRLLPSDPLPQLVVAAGDGRDVIAVGPLSPRDFYEWSPAESAYLYSTREGLGIGRIGAAVVSIGETSATTTQDAQWVDAAGFLFSRGTRPTWEMRAGVPDGRHTLLFSFNDDGSPAFDVWSP